MVAKIAKNYISDAGRTNAQIKTALEQLLDILYETPGAVGTYGSTITIASDIAQIVDSWASFIVDGEGAAADDLKAISTAGTLRDGQEIEILIADVARPIKLKHNVAGAKKLSLLGGADYTIRSVNERVRFKYNLAADVWYQKAPDYTEQLKVMLGTKAAAVIAIAGSAVTPSSAYIAVNHASANQNLDTIVRTNFPDNGRFILLTAADSAFTYTLRHNQGAAGRILTLDGASIVLTPGKFVLLETITSTTDCWKEVVRFNYGLPTNPAAGDLFVGTGSGGYAVIDGTPSDGMVATWDNAAPNKVKWAAGGGGSGALVNGCRLSASSSLSNPSTDVTGATSVYLLPHKHDKISLYSGSGSVWNDRVVTSLSLSLAGFGVARLVDIYAYDNTGTAALEGTAWDSGGQVSYTISSLTAANPCVITTTVTHAISVGDIVTITQGTSTGTAWTDADLKLTNKFFYVSAVTGTTLTLEGVDTTGLTRTAYTNAKVYKIPASRTTGQTRQNGVLCKTGALTRRFLGTVYIDGSGNLNDAVSQRFCRNVDNKEPAAFGSEDTTASFTPSATSTFYARTNSTQVGKTRSELVVAEPETVNLSLTDSLEWNTYLSSTGAAVGINRMLAASFSTYQGVLDFQISCNGTGASYANAVVTTLTNSGSRSFAAGLYFVQHMQYGAGYPYHGRAYTSYPSQAAIKAMIWR